MTNWFLCSVKYDTINERNGKDTTVSEQYLLDALSFTEAETRINKEMESLISGEFDVKKVQKTRIEDIVTSYLGEFWYKCKMVLVDVDEKSGKEKKTNIIQMCLADNVQHAYELIEEANKEILIPWHIHTIQETPIIDVFFYEKGGQDDNS